MTNRRQWRGARKDEEATEAPAKGQVMTDNEFADFCKGGPHDGQQKIYGAARMPILKAGQTRKGSCWATTSTRIAVVNGVRTQPGGDDRVR